MIRRVALALTLLTACGGGVDQKSAPTVVLCVLDSVDGEQLARWSRSTETTFRWALDWDSPGGSGYGDSGGGVFYPRTRSASGNLASLLTGGTVSEHGLRSIHEWGGSSVAPGVTTLAEQLARDDSRTIASVAEAHFEAVGLGRGFDTWHAPAAKGKRPSRSASQVYGAAAADLEAAFESEDAVFVLLHFGDLKFDRWRGREPSRAALEAKLGPWLGEEPVASAFSSEDESRTLAERLRRGLLRRSDDPRRSALLEALYADALAEIEAQLRDLHALLERHGRLANSTLVSCGGPAGVADSGPDPGARRRAPWRLIGAGGTSGPWFEERSTPTPGDVAAWPYGLARERALQGVEVSRVGEGFEGLRGQLAADAAGLLPWRERDQVGAKPGVERVTLRFAGDGAERLFLDRRGAGFQLRLQHDDLFQLVPGDVRLGATTLARSDVPELIGSRSPDWPENAIVGPLLDLQQGPRRTLEGRVEAQAGAQVELLVELFPEDLELAEGIACSEGTVERHPLRPGAAWIRATGPVEFTLPTRSPSTRLGVVLRLDGVRQPSSRMRYLKRVLSAPDVLELGFSPGTWLDPELRAPEQGLAGGRLGIDLVDELPLPAELGLPSPAELRLLRQLDADE